MRYKAPLILHVPDRFSFDRHMDMAEHTKEKKRRAMPEANVDTVEGRKKKKDKKNHESQDNHRKEGKNSNGEEIHTEDENGGAGPTLSIAVAGSIIDNAQSVELATLLAGQIARAATIFRVHEVIVFDDKAKVDTISKGPIWLDEDDNESGALFMTRILHYLEIPQYLRRAIVPKYNSLRYVGILPPLDAPHHVRKHEWVPYREGITLDRRPATGNGTLVDVGLQKEVVIEQSLKAGLRITVAMGSNRSLEADCMRKAVDSSEPRAKAGLYWGYTVRYAPNISAVFKESPYKGGYDYSIGTSEHGDTVSYADLEIPKFRHLLIAFGGLGGLEENIEMDEDLKSKDVAKLFSRYLNTCPNQGSRTIRTEEAIFISLQYFQDSIQRAMKS